ncbi:MULTISPECIES: glycosyltransferase family 2 protein [Lactococcus]|uniref:glycosyltransferase family 2 protein n=3 Tax=Streptococcaceae TaxID=1300 RepID=UPI002300B944|nr:MULTISPECIES: glycosyltransferase family 2 protein [unclassified Lactococcus]
MSEIKVSVIVPVYNVENYLEEALLSLKNQTLTDLEFIIINDGSTDGSSSIIEKVTSGDSRFRVFNVENGGIGKAFNLGVREARGEYIAEFESDDYVALNAYERLYQTAKQFDVDVVRSNWTEFSEKESIVRDILWEYPDNYDKLIDVKNSDIFVQVYPWNAIYRKAMIEKNNIAWDESVKSYGDTGLFWKINISARDMVFIKDPLYFYRQDNPNSTVNNIGKKVEFLIQQFRLIRAQLIEKGALEKYLYKFYKQMFEKYFWAIEKMTHARDERVLDVLKEMSEDFKIALEQDNLTSIDFIYTWKIQQIANNPEKYYIDYLKKLYKVSVVIPVHNASLYLRKTLQQVTEQTLREIEIIIIENGSEDNSLEIIEEFAKRDDRITFKSIGQSNPGNARNIGVQLARGEYLQFLDADDEFYPYLLHDAYYRAFNTSSDIIVFGMAEKGLNGEIQPVFNPYLENEGRFSGKDIDLRQITPYLYDKMFLLDFIKNAGLKNLDQFVAEDAFFTYTALLSTSKISSLNKELLLRIVRPEGLMGTYNENFNDELKLHFSMLKFLKTNEPEQIERYKLKIVGTVFWFLFENNRVKNDFKQLLFDALKNEYLSEYEIDTLNPLKYSNNIHEMEKIKTVQDIGKYDFETYFKIHNIKLRKESSIVPNVDIQESTGKIVFGQTSKQGENTAVRMFSIIISNAPTSNASAVINFIYMGDNKKIKRDTLLLSLLIEGDGDSLKSRVLQLEWEKGNQVFKENVYYTFDENVFSIWIGYTERYAAFDYNFLSITSREGENHFSIVQNNIGYIEDTMMTISKNRLIAITDVEESDKKNNVTVISKGFKKGVRKFRRVIKG